MEVLRLIRSWRNTLAPINKIPPEILTLIPDFWDKDDYDTEGQVIALTHVCQTWREMFTSRSSLWTYLDCQYADKTRAYLERSKSSPIDVYIERDGCLFPGDAFLEIDPPAIHRLKAMAIYGTAELFHDITTKLSHPAPLLKDLSIYGGRELEHSPMITTPLFNGGLPSLRKLDLHCVRTNLPWRNAINLTSFALVRTQSKISIKQLLDFFEGAPHLREVELRSVLLTPTDQNGRLVSLTCLKNLTICWDRPISLLIGHLSIPVGADLTTELESYPRIEDHLPRSLDNLGNLSNFTKLHVCLRMRHSYIEFTGPNGEVRIASFDYGINTGSSMLASLAGFDTSTTEHLEISYGDANSEDLRQALLPMKNLYTLTVPLPVGVRSLARALDPGTDLSNVLICPKLEEFAVHVGKDGFDIESVVGMAAARASRGAKLKFVRIVNREAITWMDTSELGKHVAHVEYDHEGVDEEG